MLGTDLDFESGAVKEIILHVGKKSKIPLNKSFQDALISVFVIVLARFLVEYYGSVGERTTFKYCICLEC